MPDGAFAETEAQFRRALGLDRDPDAARLELFTLPGLERSERVAAELDARYGRLSELWDTRPDALIVTGTEPVHAAFPDEPYWPVLTELLRWAADTVPTTLLSCLTAHASLFLFDGIVREPLPVKCSGVFDAAVTDPADPLVAGLPRTVSVPHSRLNGVPERALLDAGYTVLLGGGESGGGWSVASRTQGESTFVLCQGHLEYGTDSLLREFRRDVRRFLLGGGEATFPQPPQGYFDPDAGELLRELAAEAQTGAHTDPVGTYERFPFDPLAARVTNRWAAPSRAFFANWLAAARGATDLRRVGA